MPPIVLSGRRSGLPRESPAARRRRATRLAAAIQRAYPDAGCTLVHRDPVELLVATILSAQCTDERVNALTPSLFGRYPGAAAFAAADLAELESAVRPTGFFRNKARAIRDACRQLVAEHGGRVPREMEALVALPGVGRKTANVLRAACFSEPAIIVDTHVGRLARRLALTPDADPERIERDLMALLPRKVWSRFSHGLILHGRRVCKARRPRCEGCAVATDCPSAFVASA
jgi:endonuclease-3